jgi:hypothetical protein
MTELLLVALERLSPRVRRVVVAVGVLLALGAVIAALTLTASHGGGARPPAAHRPAAASVPHPPAAASVPDPSPRRLRPPVSTAAMVQARQVAARFLADYLPFAYGRGRALAVRGITPGLRRQLLRARAQLTPAERRRHPRVVALQTSGTTPTLVVATAVIDDGGVAAYRLRFTLGGAGGRWAVSSVEGG